MEATFAHTIKIHCDYCSQKRIYYLTKEFSCMRETPCRVAVYQCSICKTNHYKVMEVKDEALCEVPSQSETRPRF